MEERPARKPMKRSSRRKVCVFCQEKIPYIDYKDVNRLKKFITVISSFHQINFISILPKAEPFSIAVE